MSVYMKNAYVSKLTTHFLIYTAARLNCYHLFYAMTRESAPKKARTGHRYPTLYTKPVGNFNR